MLLRRSYAKGVAVCAVILSQQLARADSFVNWENPHIHPLELTPDRSRLLAVNTADDRLEVFDVSGGGLQRLWSIPVGLDPVSVRAQSNTRAWVVNHVSDSVSVVDLAARNVVATLGTLDEPADVVFAGTPQRAFVSCSQANKVLVFDPNNLASAPVEISIDGEDPRAMAVSPVGSKVYVAIFESGNRTTILGGGAAHEGFFPPNVVSHPAGPYGGTNPPPNSGMEFVPPLNPSNPPPQPVGLIVRKDADGRWRDDNAGDWTDLVSGPDAGLSGRLVGWDLLDHDVAVIDAATLSVSYVRGLMNLCMALAVNPASGRIGVVGTDARNQVRFEPNLNGRFLRVNLALVDPAAPDVPTVVDLNPHLTYTLPTLPQAERDLSIGDPRAIVWNAAGTRGYVSGMGSNNVVVVDAAGQRVSRQATIEVGQGPTGLALDESRARLYVLNKFEASISVVDLGTESELSRTAFFDPSPVAVKVGRRQLYDTHETSGLGHVACASCHPDARMDRLAWDLGNPAEPMIPFDQNCNFGNSDLGNDPCPDWHPMKGPMVTQTLQDIIGKEPHHWRGDRDGLEEFGQTFGNLQGDDETPSPAAMREFEDFLATITFPPNPFRKFNNTLTIVPLEGHYTTGIPGGAPAGQPLGEGNAEVGHVFFIEGNIAPQPLACDSCHTLSAGVGTNLYFDGNNGQPLPPGPNSELHHAVVFSPLSETPNISIKIPHLRNMHERVGFDLTQPTSRAGFGFLHDGSVDTLMRLLTQPPFQPFGIDGIFADIVAFLLSFSGSDLGEGTTFDPLHPLGPSSKDTHAAVGTQITVDATNKQAPATLALVNAMIDLTDDPPGGPRAHLVVKGRRGGLARGYRYASALQFQSDRAAETVHRDALLASAGPGAELTFTVVPRGTETRSGIDRDEDGSWDRDELDACSDPGNGASLPGLDVMTATLELSRSGLQTVLSWNEAGTAYEVVRGSLDSLRSSGGDFTAAIEACLADDTLATSVVDFAALPAGNAFFLVRASGCGTYDSEGPAQSGLRDDEIEASPASCPADLRP